MNKKGCGAAEIIEETLTACTSASFRANFDFLCNQAGNYRRDKDARKEGEISEAAARGSELVFERAVTRATCDKDQLHILNSGLQSFSGIECKITDYSCKLMEQKFLDDVERYIGVKCTECPSVAICDFRESREPPIVPVI